MNELTLDAVFSNETSVSFVPAAAEGSVTGVPMAEYRPSALVTHISTELQQPLRALYRRLRPDDSTTQGTVLLLTGCQRRNGCTTTALALAVACAGECNTILIDGDGETRGLSASLVSEPHAGWDDAVRKAVELRRAIHEFAHWPGVSLLPLRLPVTDLKPFTTDSRLPELLTALRRDYGLIIIDGGTAETCGQAWAPWADAVLLVSDAGQSADAGRPVSWDSLEVKGERVVGMIETNA